MLTSSNESAIVISTKEMTMSNEFTYGEKMFRNSYKYFVKVTSSRGEEVVSLNEGFVCPKCGKRFNFIDKKSGMYVRFNRNVAKENGICLEYSFAHELTCNEPVHRYACTLVIDTEQTYLGSFRNSPLSGAWYKFRKPRHTNRSSKGRYDSYKYYRLKNDWCYVEPIYESDDSDEIRYNLVVKFRNSNPKTNDGERRSTGWKSDKKKIRQWN